jgi:hypothetical protein
MKRKLELKHGSNVKKMLNNQCSTNPACRLILPKRLSDRNAQVLANGLWLWARDHGKWFGLGLVAK